MVGMQSIHTDEDFDVGLSTLGLPAPQGTTLAIGSCHDREISRNIPSVATASQKRWNFSLSSNLPVGPQRIYLVMSCDQCTTAIVLQVPRYMECIPICYRRMKEPF